ncbi:MAG: MerR family transcriptional regulator [Bacteroidales bacterium]|nr:MerR family transcriptional regulator [Bacteroidales bacterium]
MPYKERKVEKEYYAIGEVAEMFKVNTSLIRFWEKEFDVLKPHKNKKGNRLFTKKDIDNLFLIHHLVKEKGFTLQGAKDVLKTKKAETYDKAQLIFALNNIKDFLLEMKKQL